MPPVPDGVWPALRQGMISATKDSDMIRFTKKSEAEIATDVGAVQGAKPKAAAAQAEAEIKTPKKRGKQKRT